MKPPSFDYLAPRSLKEALSQLAEHGADAKVLAGGQSLIPLLNFRLAQPAVLIDLNRVGADSIAVEGELLRIGAMVRQRALERFDGLERVAPLLADAMPLIAHPQIRNRGTVGGSLAHADPASELPVAALALGARLVVESAARGRRTIEAESFFESLMTTALAEDEILVEVEVPVRRPGWGWSFREVARRHGDYAHAGVAVGVELAGGGTVAEARIVFLSAGDTPRPAARAAALMVGERPGAELFEAVAAAADGEIEPTGDIHATEAFKRHLARVLTRRALETALTRAEAA